MIHIHKGVYDHVLLLVDEHLPEQLELDKAWRCLVEHLDILPRRNLTLLHNAFSGLVNTHLVLIHVRIVLPILLHKSLSVAFGAGEECNFLLEHFFLYILRRVHIKHTWRHDEQELLVVCLWGRQANRLEASFDASLDFVFKPIAVVFNDGEVRVAHPGIDKFLIEFLSLLNCLIASLVVVTSVELFSAICCRHEMNNSLVAPVSELNRTPGCLVEERLPALLTGVRFSIHYSSVTQDHCFQLAIQSLLEKDVLQTHLHSHDLNLKFDLLVQSHFVGLDECSRLHHQGCCLRHDQNIESCLVQVVSQGGEGSRLACTRTTCQADPVNWKLGLGYCFWMVQVGVSHSLGLLGTHG